MTDVVLNSSSMSPANPATPPAGWQLTAGSVNGIQVGSNQIWFDTDNSYSGWNYTSAPARTGNIIESKIVLGVSPSGFGDYYQSVTLADSSGAGYMFEIQPYAFKLYRFSAGNLAGTKTQIGTASSGAIPVATDYFNLRINVSTGDITGLKNGVSVVTATDTTYTANSLKSGFAQKGFNARSGISQVTAFDVTVYSVTSINGGNPITAGQTGIAIVASGFTAKPTAVTATYAAGAKSITATIDSGGTATNFNISIQDRIEAEDWPVNGDTITFTLTYLSESATGTQTLVKKASETVLTVSGGITIDPATWTYWLTQDGFTVEGGEHDYIPYGDLVLTADGGGSATNAGTFTSWFRPATGTGAGNVYAYTWVITEAGISPAGSGLTSSGLTVSGLTSPGL